MTATADVLDAAARPVHVLTITDVPCPDCGSARTCEVCLDPDGPEQDWSITCPGVTDECEGYVECDCPESKEDDSDRLHDDPVAHGVEHRYIDGWWGRPTGRCYIQTSDYTCDAVELLKPLAAGEYPVILDDVDDGYLSLALANGATM